MTSPRTTTATIGIGVALLAIISALLALWLPLILVLRLMVSAPFIFVLPGTFLVHAFLQLPTRTERIIAAILLSTAVNTFAIFLTEELTERMTAMHILGAIIAVHVVTYGAFLVHRAHLRTGHQSIAKQRTSR
ncbi:MAG: hypothetical protein Q7T01_03560 [bacterium]|nr:hypothetical protein [bacterium]